jgi:hypothetical protein
MVYTPVTFQDNVTPLNAANLNHLEDGVEALDATMATKADTAAVNAALTLKADAATMNAADALKVDKDSVVVAATRIVANKLAGADAQPSFRVLGDGKHEWGQGGANALDTNLYRATPDGGLSLLQTDGHFWAGGSLIAARGGSNQVRLGYTIPGIHFGSANDTNLRRVSAGILQTDGELRAQHLNVSGRVYFDQTLYDTSLYRSAAGTLKTDGVFEAVGNIRAKGGSAVQVFAGDVTGGGTLPGIIFGNTGFDALYRSAAGNLKTDGAFLVGGNIQMVGAGELFLDPGNASKKIYWGSAFDTNLYRSSAGVLRTDGSLIVTNTLNAHWGGSAWVLETIASPGGGLKLGGDTNLYRSAATQLQTDGFFVAGGNIVARFAGGAAVQTAIGNYGPAGQGAISFGQPGDTSLYRAAAGSLYTDGYFVSNKNTGNANESALGAVFSGLGIKLLYAGAADSGGAGYRMVRVPN